MENVYIYTLSDNTGIRYVGKTNNLKLRKLGHINESKSNRYNNHRINWIKSLLLKNELPIMNVLDIVPNDEWIFWEIYWISQIKTWGFNLVNSTSGGENPPSYKGKTHTNEYKKIRQIIMKNNNPAKNMNDKWRDNISKSLKGRIFTNEHKLKLSKPIYQFDLNDNFIKKWDFARVASKELNICLTNIYKCANGNRNKAGNFKWRKNMFI
jgi:hypothetical protein